MVIKRMPNLPHEDIHERILELFVDDFTLLNASDVAKKAKIQRITATKHLKRLENDGVIKIAYYNTKIKLYRMG